MISFRFIGYFMRNIKDCPNKLDLTKSLEILKENFEEMKNKSVKCVDNWRKGEKVVILKDIAN